MKFVLFIFLYVYIDLKKKKVKLFTVLLSPSDQTSIPLWKKRVTKITYIL